MADEPWDVLHDPGSPQTHWTTDNVGEAAPGVLSPLGWSLWGPGGDRMSRDIAYRVGVFSKQDRAAFPPTVRPFYGRIAMRVEYVAHLGDRMPGVTGEDLVRTMLGQVPETLTFDPTRRRYPAVAQRLPRAMLRTPRLIRTMAAQTDAWWRTQIALLPCLSVEETKAVLADGVRTFDRTLTIHSLGLIAVVQPLLVELTKLVEQAGVGDVGLLSGTGGAEMAIIEDIWRASRGELTVADVIANHGFHGPSEGEVSSRVWREDPEPLHQMITGYGDLDDSQRPAAKAALARAQLPEVQREVLAALPVARRPVARQVLTLAARLLPLRGVGKRAFLQSIDVTRAAAVQLADQLDLDTFHLTARELTGKLPVNAAELIGLRTARRREYQAMTIPAHWRGVPVPIIASAELVEEINGIGVSAGVVEGRVRIVTDAAFAEVQHGEILVTPTTDPSWAAVMFISAALVVDIGGQLSHAAVVARELGIPCVVNTRVGSTRLRTGDHVRVDGRTGVVSVLKRAEHG